MHFKTRAMKSIVMITGLACVLLFGGCKKDYPNDIPQWLKKAITEFKRAGKYNNINACGECPIIVEEWKETTTGATLYAFEQCDWTSYAFYSESGQRLCSIEPMYCYPNNPCSCGPYAWTNLVKIRNIWTAHCP